MIFNITFSKIHLTVFLLSVFLFSQYSAKGQSPDSGRVIKQNGWIESMENKISIKISANNIYETFRVVTPSGEVNLYPNISTSGRINFNYKIISFAVQVSPDFLPGNGDEDLKGNTKALEFWTLVSVGKFFSNVSYSKVKGYYLQNTKDYIPWTQGDPYIQFPDLKYSGFSASAGYCFNPKFSIKNIITQTEIQRKSAGSFIPALNFRYYIINDESNGTTTQKSKNLELGLGAGYIHTFVIKNNFYASLGITPSYDFIKTILTTRYPTGSEETIQHNYAFRWDGLGAIGYNSDKFFGGFYIAILGESNQQENTTARNYDSRTFYQFFVGIRFNAIKSFKL